MTLLSRLANLLRAQFSGTIDLQHRDADWRAGHDDTGGFDYNDTTPKGGEKIDPRIAGYYANLEVPYGADIETVRKAWKRLLRTYHPDLHSSDPEKVRIANQIVQGLNKAHDELEKWLAQQGNRRAP